MSDLSSNPSLALFKNACHYGLFLPQHGQLPLGNGHLVARLVKNLSAMQETPVRFLGREDPLEKGETTHSVFLGFPGGSAGKGSACDAGDPGSIPGLGRSPGEGHGYPPTPVFLPGESHGQRSLMGYSLYGVVKSWTPLSN